MSFGGSMKFYRAGADGVVHEEKRMAVEGKGPEKPVATVRSERRQFDRRHQLRRESDEMAEQTPPDSHGCILDRLETRVKQLKQEAIDLEALRNQISNVQVSTQSGHGSQPVLRFPQAQLGSNAERALHRLLDEGEE